MNDAEWEAWRTSWTRAEGPLPDVGARASQDAKRHRRANLIFFALMAGGVLANTWALLSHRANLLTYSGLIFWAAALSIGFVWIQRGTRLGKTASPREALAFLERRVRVERQGAQLVRWVYAAGILFVGIRFRDLFGDDMVVKLVARLILLVAFLLIFSLPWWVRRVTDRQEREISLWRRWMDEQQL